MGNQHVQCPNCGSHNKVTINQKDYCAECGEPLTTNHEPLKKAAKPAPKPAKAVAHEVKPQHVLDLSQKSEAPTKHHASPKPRRAHKAAQSIHGIRRQPEGTNHAQPAEPAHKPVPKQHKHKSDVKRSSAITKFSPMLKEPAAIEAEEAPPVTLAAHQTYQVNQRSAAADRAAAIALQHQRHSQKPEHHAKAIAQAKPEKKHRRPRRIKKLFQSRPRLAMASTVAAVVLILGGYITYLNYPNLVLRVAASRAGFDASLPGYVPNGYSLSRQITSGPGQIVVQFNSNSDAGFITVAQHKTDWDSGSLLENYVMTKSDKYLTFQQNGLIIYMYNGNNAAWVNHGVFYAVEGNNYLNTEQVLKIATSL